MALVLNTTPGDPLANSYVSLEAAKAYHEGRGHNDVWTAATDDAIKKVVVWATRQLDQEDMKGSKQFPRGALRCPRAGLVDRDGLAYAPGVIPEFIQNAISEWALFLLVEDRTADAGGIVEYGGQVGPIKSPTRIDRTPMPESVREMLRPLLRANSSGTNIVMGRS